MSFRLIPFVTLLILAHSADAGPWLRDKGASFSSTSFSSTYYLDTTSQAYLEYGLTANMTLIGELGITRYNTAQQGGNATISMRRALGPKDGKSKWAYEIGIGTGWYGEDVFPHIRTGLSWGKGIKWKGKTGWTTVDASVVWDITHDLHVAKIDATLGLNLTEVTSGMIQIYTAHTKGNSTATIAPSFIFKPKERKFRVQVGTETPLRNLANSAFKIALWREF